MCTVHILQTVGYSHTKVFGPFIHEMEAYTVSFLTPNESHTI